jgi:hypothetical protein
MAASRAIPVAADGLIVGAGSSVVSHFGRIDPNVERRADYE